MEQQQVHEWIGKTRRFLRLDKLSPVTRRVVVCFVGGFLLIVGLVMAVAPGPAFVFIPLGLFLLASEFKWAEELAQKVLNLFLRARDKWRHRHAA